MEITVYVSWPRKEKLDQKRGKSEIEKSRHILLERKPEGKSSLRNIDQNHDR